MSGWLQIAMKIRDAITEDDLRLALLEMRGMVDEVLVGIPDPETATKEVPYPEETGSGA